MYDAFSEANLSRVEQSNKRKWMVTWEESKLLLIASTGFFIDAYDLFTINIIAVILNYEFNGKLSGSIANIPLKGGVLKAAANIGCVVGQVSFGLLGDIFGRKAVYGKELIVAIVATVLIISVPTYLSSKSVFTYITCFRVLLGIGIGGDYPMSAAVVSDRATTDRRGLMLTFVFAMQGWGNFIGAIVAIVLLEIFKTSIRDNKHYGHFDAVWRLLAGVILVPALGTLVQRLLLPESAKMRGVQALRDDPTILEKGTTSGLPHNYGEKVKDEEMHGVTNVQSRTADNSGIMGALKGPQLSAQSKNQASRDFREYFSVPRHAITLFATASTWFLLDITFYGINLNQAIVIQSLGLANSKEPWEYLYEQAKANLIIAAAGFLPGYYLTMVTIEYVGRKPIQLMGFLMNALFLAIIAGDYNNLKTKPGGFIVCFAFLQLFFNFGANTTTFIVPAEVFPTRVRGAAHGISAASGKVGAIIASLGFATAQAHIGTANVLWIFFGISFVGFFITFLIPETKGIDADVIDLEERQAKAGFGQRIGHDEHVDGPTDGHIQA